MARQAAALDGVVRGRLGAGRHQVLDCSGGIGTQAIGPAGVGHRVTGSDLSPAAVARAAVEAAARGVRLPVTVADMRALPFRAGAFDVVVCADNRLPHLLTADDVCTALVGMRRVLRDDGLLVLSIRDYDEIRATRPPSAPPQVSTTAQGRVVTFQLWHWHEDGARYDLEHFQLVPGEGGGWEVRVRRTAYWALTRGELSAAVADTGFAAVSWHDPGAAASTSRCSRLGGLGGPAAPGKSDGASEKAFRRPEDCGILRPCRRS